MDTENQDSEGIIKTIKNRLSKMGYDYALLNDKQQQYILKLEKSISLIFKSETELQNTFAKNKISTKTISESTNIARQTFYNVPILNEYVNFCTDEFNKISMLAKYSSMTEELQELKEKVKEMQKRDVQLELLKNEIKELKKSLKSKEEKIVLQSKKIYEMLETNNKFS